MSSRFRKRKALVFFCTILSVLLLAELTVYAQPVQRFNRFQCHKYKWRTFHTAAFDVYFPTGYDSLCSYVVRNLPYAMKKVKHDMVTSLLKKPNVILYPSPDQQYESNIGLEESQQFTLPTFMAKGNRIVLFYNGSYADMKGQMYEALVRSVWEEQLKEDDVLKGTVVEQKIPYWFREGAIKYFAQKWPVQAEDALRRSFEQNDFQSWEESIAYQPKLSGQAFCYFLTEKFYPQAVQQLFGQLKKKKELGRATRLITKRPMDALFNQCLAFYKQRFAQDRIPGVGHTISSISIKRPKGRLLDLRLSPGKDHAVYVIAGYNTRTVYVSDLRTGKDHKIIRYKLPPFIKDHAKDQYPLISWEEDGKQLVVTLPVKGKVTILKYTTDGIEVQKDKLYGTDGITGLQSTGDHAYLLSAFRQGQSDIISYDTRRERYIPLTTDIYDDRNAVTDQAKSRIVFISDRPDKEVKKGDSIRLRQGIFSLKDKQIIPVVVDSVPYIKWDHATLLRDGRLLATNTKAGAERFSIDGQQLSEYHPFQYLPASNEISFYKTKGDSIIITTEQVDEWVERNKTDETTSPWLEDYRRRATEEAKIDSMLRASKDETPSFLEGVLIPKDAKERSKQREDSISRSLAWTPQKVKPYILQLHSAYFTAKVNNDYFINRYQPYLNYQGQFKFPQIAGMVQGGFTDLFENHHFNIAYRLPAGTEGSDFFVRYENTARKLDWGLTYFRKVESLQPDPERAWKDENGRFYPNTAKVKTHYYEVSLHYPITYELSAGGEIAMRQDRTIFQATEQYSLTFEDIKGLWMIVSPHIKINKLQPTIPLLYKGFTGKLQADVFKGFSQQEEALLGTQLSLSYHQPLYRYITAVVQGRVGYSAGKSRVLYNLGGTDNNVVPKADSNVHFSQDAPYAFQTLVTPFRGHLQNKLYGDQYALLNADVYFPLFQTLIPIETPLQSLNLLQLGIFTDAATAKESWNKTNSSSTALWSYGLSARTQLAGYPLKLEVAWPGAFSEMPVWYFSLSLK